MRRLNGVDAYLWYNETPTNHMHTLKIAVLDPARSTTPFTIAGFVRGLHARMHLLPSFRWRLVETPFGLHHPVWVEDPDFDITLHVRHGSLPAPGGRREMDDAIARIGSTPLRRDRPLWELHLLEGLEHGRVLAVTKIHHAMADGQAASNQLLNVMDLDPGRAPAPVPWDPPALPSAPALLLAALSDHPGQLRRLPDLVRRSRRGDRAARRFWRTEASRPTRPWSGRHTFLNTPIDADRTVATASLPLAEVMPLRQAGSFTLNDVVLELLTGALREVLAGRGELPDVPLVANIPAATGALADRLHGNSVSLLFASLPVQLPDAAERLKTIHDATRAARRANELAGRELLDQWLAYVPPKPFAWLSRWYARSALVRRRPPMMNLVASNVRGPAEEVAVAGVPIVDLYSVGPLNINMALNVTVWSYAGKLNFTVLSCPRQLPDAHVITDAIVAAHARLAIELGVTAVSGGSGGGGSGGSGGWRGAGGSGG